MQRSTRLLVLVLSFGLLLASWPVAGYAQPMADEPVVQPDFGATSIAWSAPQGSGSFILVVSGPDGYRFEQTFQSGAPLAFQAVDANGAALADGLYKYELTPVRYDLTKARSQGDDGRNPAETRELVQSQANLNANLSGVSGVFTIQNGAILNPSAVEEETTAAQPQQGASPAGIDAPADQVILDDLIVDGSACIGQDCVNGENFGFDTLRLKENNLRIKAQDTSTSASFPTVDWQLTFNDSSNGGANKFSIDDIDNGKTPFTIEANTPSNSLYLDSTGQVGFGTSTPVVELHVKDGDTPTLRLEQDGSSGFTSQIWDMAGNETNFFVRDVTNGSKLPFRIQPSAPTSSIYIKSTGDVGMGAGTSPSASLHVKRTDGTAQILVEEANATVADRTLAELKNNGKSFITLQDTRVTDQVKIGSNFGRLTVELGGSARLAQSNTDGTLTVLGNLVLNGGSCTGCRTSNDLWEMSQEDMLNQLSSLSIVRWDGTGIDLRDSSGSVNGETVVTHLSPDMQSFYAAFGLGLNGEQIAPLDVATVALASIQALKETVDQQSEIIAAQNAQLAAMDERIKALESMSHTHSYLPSIQN